ncbi:MAG: stage III sporulation protein AB [Huintestinicola sp.]
MKLTGIVILAAMSICTGFIAADGLMHRLQALKQLRMMLENIRLMIRYESVPLDEIFRRLSENESYDRLLFIAPAAEMLQGVPYAGTSFSSQWEDIVNKHCGSFTREDTDIICSLGTVLGTTDTEGQLSALSLAVEMTDTLISDASEQYRAKGRLYRSLGAIAGALIAVIII